VREAERAFFQEDAAHKRRRLEDDERRAEEARIRRLTDLEVARRLADDEAGR
jgi:hypothetical protein